MNKLRFSLATLISEVFVIAAGLAALRYASQFWAAAIFSSDLVILLLAILGAVFGREQTCTFWSGFAIFGLTYMLVALGPWFADHTAPHLFSNKLLSARCVGIVGSTGEPSNQFRSLIIRFLIRLIRDTRSLLPRVECCAF